MVKESKRTSPFIPWGLNVYSTLADPDGHPKEWATLQSRLLAYVNRRVDSRHLDGEEVAAQALLRAHLNLSTFEGRNDAPCATWLLKIARNAAVDLVRRPYRRREEPAGLRLIRTSPLSIDDRLVANEQQNQVREAVEELTGEQQLVIKLKFF